MADTVDASSATTYQIHSEARGLHWIAWISRASDAKPDRSVVLVAATQEEAQARARALAERATP